MTYKGEYYMAFYVVRETHRGYVVIEVHSSKIVFSLATQEGALKVARYLNQFQIEERKVA